MAKSCVKSILFYSTGGKEDVLCYPQRSRIRQFYEGNVYFDDAKWFYCSKNLKRFKRKQIFLFSRPNLGVEINYCQPTRILAVEPTTIIAHQSKGPPPSPIWNYFVRDTERKVAICKACGGSIRIAAGTTSGIVYHLKATHFEEFELYKLQKQEWERLKDFYVYQNYMKNRVKKKIVQVVQMNDSTSAIIVDPS
ncbi:hypothetical protein RUM44_009664 [Polyplax serrata]|uniref:BED-type domain-containing protein n=1 Tax=Polyplax serrata TaxID=468196 RepID=A0ABR1ATC6_POLSC